MSDESISQITVAIHKTFLPADLRSDKISEVKIDDLVLGGKPDRWDAVIFLIGDWVGSKHVMKESNFEVPKRVIDYCKENNARHFIFASSINIRLHESNVYAEYKRQIESYLKNSGVPYTIFRPALIFGPGDKGLSKIYNFIRRFSVAPVFGDGKKLEQPIYVKEAAEYFYKAALAAPENKTYEIGGLTAYSYNDLMLAMAKIAGRKVALFHIASRPFFYILLFLEKIGLNLPINSEQILHIDTDLDIDNSPAVEKYNVILKPFEYWLTSIKDVYGTK
jgi:NADH dehydrogenase